MHFSRTGSLPPARDSSYGSLQDSCFYSYLPPALCCNCFCHVVLPIEVIGILLKRRGEYLSEISRAQASAIKAQLLTGKKKVRQLLN